jgi:hypothetical protein
MKTSKIRPTLAMHVLSAGVHAMADEFANMTRVEAAHREGKVTKVKGEKPRFAALYHVGPAMSRDGTEISDKMIDRMIARMERKHMLVTVAATGFRVTKKVTMGGRRFRIRAKYNAKKGTLRISSAA